MIIKSKNPYVYGYVEIKSGEIVSIGDERGRDGGEYWHRKYHRKGWEDPRTEEETKKELKKELMIQIEEFGIDYYEVILDEAKKDAEWLPSAGEMRLLVLEKRLFWREDELEDLNKERDYYNKKIREKEKEIRILKKDIFRISGRNY